MSASAVHDFNLALLDLDAAVRRITTTRDVSERQSVAFDAYKRFLRTVTPFRLKLLITEGGNAPIHHADALELLRQALAIAEQGGVPRAEIVALVNRETMETH